MTNKFCHFLSNGYTMNIINNKLTKRPCAVYTKSIPLLDSTLIKKELEYMDSATDWLPECQQCQRIEKFNSGTSMRTLSKYRVVGDFQPGDCVSLDLYLYKRCNAACLSCSPTFSSTWDRYKRKYDNNHVLTSANSDDLFQEFIDSVKLDKLQFLFIQGGEPFYSKTNLNILEHLLDIHPNTFDITINYQTNGSILPTDQIMEYWKKFKSVIISYSIDDINDRFNYLRWPLDWNRVSQNIKTMIETTEIKFRFNCTINPLNILDYNNLESWILETVPSDRLIRIRAGGNIGELDIRHSPKNLREAVLKKYHPEHEISRLVGNPETYDYHKMINYVEKHDKLRQLDWKKTFPESVKFFT